MAVIAPVSNDLMELIKGDEYRSLISQIGSQFEIMSDFIGNLDADIDEITKLDKSLKRDQERGYDVGSSLETLAFQKDTLSLDRDFFVNQRQTYMRKIYKDLFLYAMDIIMKAVEIEDIPEGMTDEQVINAKLGGCKVYDENDNSPFGLGDINMLLSNVVGLLNELARDIGTFDSKITDAEEKESRGFSVGNIILNLKQQKSGLQTSFGGYCQRISQFLEENLKFAKKCVRRVELISGEIKSQDEVDAAETGGDAGGDAGGDDTAQ